MRRPVVGGILRIRPRNGITKARRRRTRRTRKTTGGASSAAGRELGARTPPMSNSGATCSVLEEHPLVELVAQVVVDAQDGGEQDEGGDDGHRALPAHALLDDDD